MDSATIQTVLYIGVLGVVFYLLIIRPQQKQRKDHQALMDALVAGDKVVTIGGVHGTVKSVNEDAITLEIASGVVITVARGAVSQKNEA